MVPRGPVAKTRELNLATGQAVSYIPFQKRSSQGARGLGGRRTGRLKIPPCLEEELPQAVRGRFSSSTEMFPQKLKILNKIINKLRKKNPLDSWKVRPMQQVSWFYGFEKQKQKNFFLKNVRTTTAEERKGLKINKATFKTRD